MIGLNHLFKPLMVETVTTSCGNKPHNYTLCGKKILSLGCSEGFTNLILYWIYTACLDYTFFEQWTMCVLATPISTHPTSCKSSSKLGQGAGKEMLVAVYPIKFAGANCTLKCIVWWMKLVLKGMLHWHMEVLPWLITTGSINRSKPLLSELF